MALRQLFAPKPTISDQDVNKGLRWMTLEGMASMGFWSIITSGFLAAYALALGANNLQIGVLAALPFITQPIQIVAIPLIERIRRRKVVAVAAWIPAQALWVVIALIPVFMDVPSASAISLLLLLMGFRGVLVALTQCAWNSWLRDLIPQQILGRFFARRLVLANLVGVFFALSAAFFADHWRGGASGEEGALVYTIPLLFGALTLAMASPFFMTLMPEPLMQRIAGPQPSLWSTVTTPFRDRNYRHLLKFLFLWGIALNLATPFFVVYMLQVLGLSLAAVIGLTTLSQAMNILFLGLWGRFADRFGSKAILSLSASLYLLVIMGWIFTAMPDRYFFTIPLLVILHMTAGVAAAGVTLTTGTIGMKLAPEGQGTPYIAAAAIATSLGAGIGPLLGGLFADFFSVREFGIDITWVDPTRSLDVSALHLTGFEFLFGVAFVLGLLSINLLTALREEGEAGREVVLDALNAPMRRLSRPMSSVPGLNFLTQFPFGFVRRTPVPGVDVALGVTGYQIANTARAATETALRGQQATAKAAKAIEDDLSEVLENTEPEDAHGPEIARHAARGVIHSVKEVAHGVGHLADQAVVGIMRAMGSTGLNPEDNLRGAGHGIVEGAVETGSDLGEAVRHAIEAAKEVAHDLGLPEDVAAEQTARGILEAAEAAGPEALAQVRASLPRGLLPPDQMEAEIETPIEEVNEQDA